MERMQDKAFANSWAQQLQSDDKNRQQFFNRLNNIQLANDKKHQNHMKYMSQDPAALGALQDEQNYMKNMQK